MATSFFAHQTALSFIELEVLLHSNGERSATRRNEAAHAACPHPRTERSGASKARVVTAGCTETQRREASPTIRTCLPSLCTGAL